MKDDSKTSTRAVCQRTHLLSELCSTCFSLLCSLFLFSCFPFMDVTSNPSFLLPLPRPDGVLCKALRRSFYRWCRCWPSPTMNLPPTWTPRKCGVMTGLNSKPSPILLSKRAWDCDWITNGNRCIHASSTTWPKMKSGLFFRKLARSS